MSKHFITSLFLMILLNVIIKPVWIFGIDRQVQILVGQSAYGKYFALLNLSFVFNIVLDLGITGYITRSVASDHNSLSHIARQTLLAKLFFSLLYLVIVFSIALVSGVTDFSLLFLLCLLQLLTSFLLWGRGIVSALQKFKTDSFLSVADKALLILLAGLWLYLPGLKNHITITGFTLLQIITVAVSLLICFYYLSQQTLFSVAKIQSTSIRDVMKQTWPYAATVFFMAIHNRADAFLLERFHTNGSHEAGIYASAYRLLDAANMIGYLFATILISFWAKHASEPPVIKKSLSISHQLLVPAGILAAITAVLLSTPVYKLLYHHEDVYGSEILKWCLPVIVPYFITHLYGTLLTATGRVKLLMWMVIGAAVFNFAANLILIPVYGAMACVMVSLTSQTILAIMTVVVCRRKIKTDVNPWLWIKYILLALVLAGVIWPMDQLGLSIWTKLVIIVFTWFIVMNILRIFSVRSFLNILREN